MFFLLFILSVFSAVTDTCVTGTCKLEIHYQLIPVKEVIGDSTSIKAQAITLNADYAANIPETMYSVTVSDATASEIAAEIKRESIHVDIKGKLEAGTNLSNIEMREILLYLLSK